MFTYFPFAELLQDFIIQSNNWMFYVLNCLKYKSAENQSCLSQTSKQDTVISPLNQIKISGR